MEKNFNISMFLLYPNRKNLLSGSCLKKDITSYKNFEKALHNMVYEKELFTHCFYVFCCKRYINILLEKYEKLNISILTELFNTL